jgi:O-methyltransferase
MENIPNSGKVGSTVFTTRIPFRHSLPYEDFYAEKVPLLSVFRMTIGDYLMRKSGAMRGFNFLRAIRNRMIKEDFIAVECGVYQGHSLIACAELAREARIPFHIYGLDSFTGFPQLSETDRLLAPPDAPYLSKSLFQDASLEDLQLRLKNRGLDKQVTLIPGFFKDSLRALNAKQYAFVNIDCDLYEPHLECLEFFYPRMMRGGVMFFDDYHSVEYPMARKAIDEFVVGRQEQLFHLTYGEAKINHTKSFLMKF